MANYLLLWNPEKWPWDDLQHVAEQSRQGQIIRRRWSCGNTKCISAGDSVFLLRKGSPPRGLVALGVVDRDTYQDEHWDEENNGEANYVDILFTGIQPPPDRGGMVIEKNTFRDEELAKRIDQAQASGVSLSPYHAALMFKNWADANKASSR